MKKRGLMVLAWLVLAGCSTTIPTPRYASTPGQGDNFAGIDALLDTQVPVDVLLVHGMCTYDGEKANAALRSLAAALGATDPAPGIQLPAVTVPGTQIQLVQQTYTTPRGSVRANAIVWSPLTTPRKKELCYDQSHKSATCEGADAYPYPRASANRFIKDSLLNDCLADALIYQGRARNGISLQMQEAVLYALSTSGRQKSAGGLTPARAAETAFEPLVVITSSLGSKIAFDALFKMTQRPDTELAARRTFGRTAQIFMRANQLPILGLADTDLDGNKAAAAAGVSGGAAFPADPIAALLDAPGIKASRRMPLQVVAFTDPNDLLSYVLVPSPHAARAGYGVTDVVLSNAPTFLGFIERPDKAHSDYDVNDHVNRLIVCGNSAHDCRAGPRR